MIDALTMAEAQEIVGYWEQNPPPHLILQAIARMLGWTPPRAPASGNPTLTAIAADVPPGLAVTRGADPGLPLPRDEGALRAENRRRAVAIARRNRVSE